MPFLLLFFAELLALFFLSRSLTRNISMLIYRITRSKHITVYGLAVLFFPGTVIHEVAHYLMAHLLFVPAGEMHLLPKLEEGGVKLGSVMVGRSDPLRRALIGVAPFLAGTSLIFLGLSYFQSLGETHPLWITILIGAFLFEISNTMFSSRKDMEGTLELFVAVIIVSVIFYFLGIRIPILDPSNLLTNNVVNLLKTGSILLSVPLVIDIATVTLLKLINRW